MKIGILTFHWATNYGAILQSYCLQEYLKECGHDVEIINYKPYIYDKTWSNFFKNPKNIKRIFKYSKEIRKEKLLQLFRDEHLNQSCRYSTCRELAQNETMYDVIISGSDQVLNPTFTIKGEGTPSSAYYLQFSKSQTKRVGYAVSFGCTNYPSDAMELSQQWIQNFDVIGVRENTGITVLDQLQFKNSRYVVPDPTILYGRKLFEKLGIEIPETKKKYTCVYMLRKELIYKDAYYLDDKHEALSIQKWLGVICNAECLITNSYHGMIMAILSHVPFVALLEDKNKGMNDRFFTLLDKLNLTDRIVDEPTGISNVLSLAIEWKKIDKLVAQYSNVGKIFIENEITKVSQVKIHKRDLT